jgi:hypothetical protein
MDPVNRDERRNAKRVLTQIVGLRLDGVWNERASIHDVSVSGMRIEDSGLRPELGCTMRVEIPCPGTDAQSLQLEGKVVRVGAPQDGFALFFDKSSDELATLVTQLLVSETQAQRFAEAAKARTVVIRQATARSVPFSLETVLGWAVATLIAGALLNLLRPF